jgi:hypothetical protein
MFGHERLNRERGRLGDERDRGLAEIADASLDIEVGAADQRPRPPSGAARTRVYRQLSQIVAAVSWMAARKFVAVLS